jgi:hypothetical protein
MKVYFDVGTPAGHDVIDNASFDLLPRLIKINE